MSLKVQLSQIDENVNSRFLVSAVITEKSIMTEIILSFGEGRILFARSSVLSSPPRDMELTNSLPTDQLIIRKSWNKIMLIHALKMF